MNKILITGSTGFIGSNLVRYLIEKENSKIYALSRAKAPDNGSQNISYIQHDFLEQLKFEQLPSDLDCIVHLAATMEKTVENSQMFQINTTGTLDLLEYGRNIRIKKFIFASTGGIYGYSIEPLSEGSQANPIGFYGLSKYQSEILVRYYSQYFSTVNLRLFFPYGEKQIRGIVPLLYGRISKGQAVTIYNEGYPHINPIHVSDVIEVIQRIIDLPVEEYCVLNVAGTEIVSIKNLAEKIGNCVGVTPKYEYVMDDKILRLVGDIKKMKRLLRYNPKVTLDDGVMRTISSYREVSVRK